MNTHLFARLLAIVAIRCEVRRGQLASHPVPGQMEVPTAFVSIPCASITLANISCPTLKSTLNVVRQKSLTTVVHMKRFSKLKVTPPRQFP